MDSRDSINASRNSTLVSKPTVSKSNDAMSPKNSRNVSRKPSNRSIANKSVMSGDSIEMIANMDINKITLTGK